MKKRKLKKRSSYDSTNGVPVTEEAVKEWTEWVVNALEEGHNPAWARSGRGMVFGHRIEGGYFNIYVVRNGYEEIEYKSKKVKK